MATTATGIDEKMVGICVFMSADYHYLRLNLRPFHLKALGAPKKIGIRGNAQEGYQLAPDNHGLKPRQISSNLFYLASSVANVGLSTNARRIVWMRPEIERAHIRLPPMPQAWIDAEEGFEAGQQFEETNRHVRLTPAPGDDPVRLSSEAQLIAEPAVALPTNGNGHHQGVTAPLPKAGIIPSSAYTVPATADMEHLQSELGRKLAEAREILRVMQERTGLKMGLDRNLRLVVLLPGN